MLPFALMLLVNLGGNLMDDADVPDRSGIPETKLDWLANAKSARPLPVGDRVLFLAVEDHHKVEQGMASGHAWTFAVQDQLSARRYLLEGKGQITRVVREIIDGEER
jgi:hypothetical protein